MSNPILRLEGLSKFYTGTSSVVMGLNDVNLAFHPGEFVAITGESGSGKSTLAHVIGGILPYESGEMYLAGKPTSHYDSMDYERYRRDQISFISQSYGILPGCSVEENVISAPRLSGMEKAQAKERASQILHQVELWEYRTRRAGKLSSGQKQRLSIARALAKPAPILLADEPTGNLDPENSAKIISLLAQAAKERLVILITHEFSEVADCATRHIALQDGRVIMDAQLRPAENAQLPTPPKKVKQHLTPYVSRLQLAGRPVWAGLVALFFTLTAFAVFAFLGTFIIALDDTNTRIYDPSAFRNGSQTRIVVTRSDGKPMTAEDHAALANTQYVSTVERSGSLTDVNYGYRQNVDYAFQYTAENLGTSDDPNRVLNSNVYLGNTAPYLQTVPLLPEGETFLTAGRLPQNIREVVLCGSADQIGKTIPVFIQDVKHWSISSLVSLEVTVVGVTDMGEHLYFHEDLGRAFTHYIRYDYFFLPFADLAEGQFRPSEYMYQQILSSRHPAQVHFPQADGEYVTLSLLLEGENKWHTSLLLNNYMEISSADFDRLIYAENDGQVSLTIADYAYTDRVLEALQNQGYIALSPFRNGSTKVDPDLAEERKQTLGICLAVLAAVLVLQVTVLRALFGTQTESYQLLSNIGLTCRTARRSIALQLMGFTLVGQLVGAGLLLAGSALGIKRIVHVLRYLPPAYMGLLSAVHLLGTALGGILISTSLAKLVFPLSGKQIDLSLEEEEVAV